MDIEAYHKVRKVADGAGYRCLARALIKVTGRDRLTFLQGQVSQDMLDLHLGVGARACLLSTSGHLVADLVVYAFADHVVIETDSERKALVLEILDRYIIREQVCLEDVTDHWTIVTFQGAGAARAWENLTATLTDIAVVAVVVQRNRLGASDGLDVWLPAGVAPGVLDALSNRQDIGALDEETYEVFRIEAARGIWGAELDENIIPLEAEMFDAISRSKGCYVGQEIIARILSRGHTNRSLRQLYLTSPARPGDDICAPAGACSGEVIGRITSAAVSPALGAIALGYVRNQYAANGASVIVNGTSASINVLAFSHSGQSDMSA